MPVPIAKPVQYCLSASKQPNQTPNSGRKSAVCFETCQCCIRVFIVAMVFRSAIQRVTAVNPLNSFYFNIIVYSTRTPCVPTVLCGHSCVIASVRISDSLDLLGTFGRPLQKCHFILGMFVYMYVFMYVCMYLFI